MTSKNQTPIEIAVTPPDSLVQYEAPLFAGIEPSSKPAAKTSSFSETNAKLDDMINSMLPPR